MKKIVSAALVASLVAGVAFAADAKITLNYRTKLDAFAYTKAKAGDTETTTKEWLDWAGYDGAGAQAATNSSDTFKFVLDGERAGVTFATNVATSSKTSKDAALFTLNQYSAWMSWELGPGVLKLETGNWKDGYADGAYRVKKDVDAQNAEGMDFERFKLGSLLNGSKGLTFVDNLGGTNTALSSYASYGFDAADGVNLNVLLGSVYNKFDKVTDDDTTTYYDAYFVSRIQAKMEVLNAEFIYKQPALHTHDLALYVMPKVMDTLTLNVGGALELNTLDKDDGGYTDWGFDLRARFQATEALSISFFTNISGTNLDAGRAISSGVAGHKGAEGLAKTGEGINTPQFKTAMWNNLSARFKISDALAATLNVGLITPLSKADNDENSYSPEWRVTPAIQVYASSNASIWAGLALSGASATVSDKDYSVFALQIPVVMRVKM
ncbi:MAG: hypothetical protein K5873_02305 [Treponema sp.]|nr:hypothetical protein [Treponema sp.]